MKAVQIEKTGSLDDVVVRDVPEAPLGNGEVRVAVHAAGVNPSDVAIVMGKFPQLRLPRVLGRDFAGRVVEGPPEWKGADVWGSGGSELGLLRDGAHAESVTVPLSALARRPAQLSAESAAAAGVPFVTAWSALVDLAGIRDGEWVVVSGAAGAVGSAAVQIASALGASVVALVRESDDVSELEGLGVAAIARSERNELAETVSRLTNGKGADVALNGVGAPVFMQLFEALGKDGRMTVYSAAAGRDAQLDLFALYRKRLTLHGLDTAAIGLAAIGAILSKVSAYFESGRLRAPRVDSTYPLERAQEAYRRVSDGRPGKAVLVNERR
ncbi:MAG TPA: zinc-binding alcohol dehydrogenase family protein [Candidatus Acidoferrales bacterium]|nr:zinc-binding alcohol dehydrogenase family protein [Candidatus Acidoferrales bacterium]